MFARAANYRHQLLMARVWCLGGRLGSHYGLPQRHAVLNFTAVAVCVQCVETDERVPRAGLLGSVDFVFSAVAAVRVCCDDVVRLS